MSFRIEHGQYIPVKNNKVSNSKNRDNLDFQKHLIDSIKKQNSLRISAHAEQRMVERDIVLGESDLNELNKVLNNLEKKGARESLLLYKDYGLIASVNNRTIITALEKDEMDIVTNIDSAVIVK